jgi:hypothetical protein
MRPKHDFEDAFRQIIYLVISAGIVAVLLPLLSLPAQAANTIQTPGTSYRPTITERIDVSGCRKMRLRAAARLGWEILNSGKARSSLRLLPQ